MSFQKFSDSLVPFESFDPRAFVAEAGVSQEVCNLMLSFALAYNDFRDIAFAHALVNEVGEIPENPPSQRLGFRNGLRNTVIRVQAGFVHELLDLIRDNHELIQTPYFQSIVRKLSSDGRAAWSSLVSVAVNKPSNDMLAQALVIIRNKIAFHYDSTELSRGYSAAFIKDAGVRQPLLSRGTTLKETRFYFADAAAQASFLARAKAQIVDDFFRGKSEFLQAINRALFEMVTRFIQTRSPWISPKPAA